MRARYPDSSGFIERDGVRVGYEVYGDGGPTVLLMPTWSIVHSRHWKLQIAHLARRARVLTFDGRGNGRSDRPLETAAYSSAEFVADALAVLDAVGAGRAVVVGASMGAGYALELAATAPERVTALALLGASLPFIADDAPGDSTRADEQPAGFHDRQEAADGWGLYNAHVWRERYPDFVDFFFGQVFSEPHSTKAIEDCVSWAGQTDGETLIRAEDATYLATDRAGIDDLLARVHCPALVIHGDDDHISRLAVGEALARAIGAELLVISGGGHLSQARDPVVVNRALGQFLDRVALDREALDREALGAPARHRNQEAVMRARYPESTGFVERDGVKVAYEVFGTGEPAVVFTPTDAIVQSRAWKAQVPYLARYSRVVTIDPRGNGRSDHPTDPAAYSDTEFVADIIAVLDEVGIGQAVLVGSCIGSWRALLTAATHPDRVLGVVGVASTVPHLTPTPADRAAVDFEAELDAYEGWDRENRNYWHTDWRGYLEFLFGELIPEPHSTKPIEDCVSWGLDIGPDTMLTHEEGRLSSTSRQESEAVLARVRCPVLVIHGTDDRWEPHERGEIIAELTGGQLLSLIGAGGVPEAREPVVVNHAIRDFVAQFAPPRPVLPVRRWTRALDRRKRILYLSSPIGLGHSRRDVAIVDELRRQHPDVAVDWLAQHPLTELLERRGERIHPASAFLANESRHLESEAAEHDLHAFQAIRSMDEIMVNNFMVFADVVEEQHYDAWVGDEAWELDYFLHENPELKRAPYVWLTDFVGWLPMADGGVPEAALTADYNAEMIEQIARFPRLRDRALFVGNPDDLVPDLLGPNLPAITDWTGANFDFVGYVTGFDPAEVADTAAVRAELGYTPDELVCIVTVGGSGVGGDLLRRVIAAYPLAKRLVPALRMIVVCGPRIDPASLPAHPGLEVRGYVHDLYRHLAGCDLAVVQGGLTTTMELTANRRPFLYVPLRHHFEQNFHVRHRLDHYGAGRCLDYADTDPEALAHAIAAEIGRPVSYRPVETDGARRAAERIADLL